MAEDINEIDPGRMNKRGHFQKKSSIKDAAGQRSGDWENIFASKVWVELIPISGRELLAANQVQGETTHRIRCRYRNGLNAATRFVFGSRVFDIQAAINPREEGAMLEIMTKEGVASG